MKSDEFHRWVERNGWVYVRKAGSHVIYRKGARTYPVRITELRRWVRGWSGR